MPQNNHFQHQNYPTQPAIAPKFRRLTVTDGDGLDFSHLHSALSVREVVVVHGTFMGDDPFGVCEMMSSIADSVTPLRKPLEFACAKLKERTTPFTQKVTRDVGNYTPEFGTEFQKLVGDDPPVRLLQPTWTGQNHHFARADLAVRLLCRLNELQPEESERILLWGHSHAGNAFALLSNLLANDRATVAAFFETAEPKLPPHWEQARSLLLAAPSPHPWAKSVLIAAFGTPVRYGWDTAGYGQLVHVLHHRNYQAEHPLITKPMFPPHSLPDTIKAKYGDWVQSFAIAGTDVSAPTSIGANKKLTALLEAGLEPPVHGFDTKLIVPERIRNACARWKTGTRCHADGLNLLVDYEPCGRTSTAMPIEAALLGHGVATTVDWLPAHLAMVMDSLHTD